MKILQKTRTVNENGIIKRQAFNSKAILKANKQLSLQEGWVDLQTEVECSPKCRGVLPDGSLEICQNGNCVILPI